MAQHADLYLLIQCLKFGVFHYKKVRVVFVLLLLCCCCFLAMDNLNASFFLPISFHGYQTAVSVAIGGMQRLVCSYGYEKNVI